MTTDKQVEIINRVDADDWDSILEAFGGFTPDQIESVLDDRFPGQNNSELSQIIFDEVSRFLAN